MFYFYWYLCADIFFLYFIIIVITIFSNFYFNLHGLTEICTHNTSINKQNVIQHSKLFVLHKLNIWFFSYVQFIMPQMWMNFYTFSADENIQFSQYLKHQEQILKPALPLTLIYKNNIHSKNIHYFSHFQLESKNPFRSVQSNDEYISINQWICSRML